MTDRFSEDELAAFAADGFAVVPGLAEAATVAEIRRVTARDLGDSENAGDGDPVGPVEYEAEVGYPGAPARADRAGGNTVRRLKNAFGRSPVFCDLLTGDPVRNRLAQLLGDRPVVPLAHHNCVMTKQPRFSSDTGWHQDVRYWHFRRPELVNVWVALGDETPANGCLRVIPGTHESTFRPEQFDAAKFLRADAAENAGLLARATDVPLGAGDGLFFHARLFHAARRNRTGRSRSGPPCSPPARPTTRRSRAPAATGARCGCPEPLRRRR